MEMEMEIKMETETQHSSGAVPFTTMIALLLMWFGGSVPLVLAGGYFGFRKEKYKFPVGVNTIARQIPEAGDVFLVVVV